MLAFHLPYMFILGTNHCGELQRTAFKRRKLFQDVLCSCFYDERVVAIFSHQKKSEYHGGNISFSIEGISLEHFSALPKSDSNSTSSSRQRHTVFHYFYLVIANKMLSLLLHTASV